MGYLPSFRNKAARFTTVLLNPISSDEHPPHRTDEVRMQNTENEVSDGDSGDPDGPDTSSFTAFLFSFLSSSGLGSHLEDLGECDGEIGAKTSGSSIKENGGRKSLFSRGKQSLGRVFNKATKLTGLRHSLESKVDSNMINNSKLVGHELRPMKAQNETVLNFEPPEVSEPSMLLSENMRATLHGSLPSLVQGRKWVLLYSTWKHGISLSTLYRRSVLCPGYSLLVVGDQQEAVFGGLVEAPLRPTNKRKYQGTNNNFVFTNQSGHLVIFRPTGANHYFTLCSTDFLALGGGGHFALYLDGDLLYGSSSTSETFSNSCLARAHDFEIREVELWGFVYASKYDEMVDLCRTEKPGICRW